jgi:hypothetical protein
MAQSQGMAAVPDIVIDRGRVFELPITRWTDATKTTIDPFVGPATNYEADLRITKDYATSAELATFAMSIDGSGILTLTLDDTVTGALDITIAVAYFDVKDISTGNAFSVLPEPMKVKIRGVVTD